MEYLQRLAEVVLAQLQLKIHDRGLLDKYEELFAKEYWNGMTLDAAAQLCEEETSYQELKKTCECAGRILQYRKSRELFLRYEFRADARLRMLFWILRPLRRTWFRQECSFWTGQRIRGRSM